MKLKLPEILALALLIFAFIFPPWRLVVDLESGTHFSRWAFILSEPDGGGIPSIDIAMLAVELTFIAGIYILLKKLVS